METAVVPRKRKPIRRPVLARQSGKRARRV